MKCDGVVRNNEPSQQWNLRNPLWNIGSLTFWLGEGRHGWWRFKVARCWATAGRVRLNWGFVFFAGGSISYWIMALFVCVSFSGPFVAAGSDVFLRNVEFGWTDIRFAIWQIHCNSEQCQFQFQSVYLHFSLVQFRPVLFQFSFSFSFSSMRLSVISNISH